ncbi:MAG: sodium:solute symporter [Bacteroidota bacterium]
MGYFFKDNNSSEDYFLGGRSMGWFPLSLSTMATQLSAISFISAPAFVGMKQGGGMQWLTYELGVPLAMIFIMVVLIPNLYKSGIVSVYEYLERRFNASTRLLISTVFQISRSFATGVMVYAVALILQSVIQIPFWQTIMIIGVITLIYSYQGGMKAVIWGDVIQMIILFGGIIICLIYGITELGGWSVFMEKVDIERTMVIDFGKFGFNGDGFGFWPMLIGGFFLYVSYYGTDQSQSQRLLSAKDLSTVRQLLTVNGLLRFPVTLIYCIMGLVLGTLLAQDPSFQQAIADTFTATDGALKSQTDLLVPIFITKYLPHGIIGILLVAILSAAMSSLSSAINSLSAVSMEDYVKRFKKNMNDKEYVRYSQGISIFWGLVCLGCAFVAGGIADTVIEAINKVGSAFYGPILGAFTLAMLSKRTQALDVNIGIIVGVLFNFYLWIYVPEVFWFWWNAIGGIMTITIGVVLGYIRNAPAKGETISLTDLNFNTWHTYALVGFFGLIILVSVMLPGWFGA